MVVCLLAGFYMAGFQKGKGKGFEIGYSKGFVKVWEKGTGKGKGKDNGKGKVKDTAGEGSPRASRMTGSRSPSRGAGARQIIDISDDDRS